MSEFSIKKDWKNINWKSTFQYNVFRSLCATPVWILFVWLTGSSQGKFPTAMLLFPVVYFAFWVPFGLITGWLARMGVPFIWMLSIVSSLVIVIGDPIVWLVHKIKSDLVPVEKPKFLDFHLIVFVTNNSESIPLCKYGGRIIANSSIEFLGEAFPVRKTLFTIKPDWSVETLKDKYFGFVDIQGAIKKGRFQKGVDPRETNIGEMVAYIGNDGYCYNPQQQRIGQYDTMPDTSENEKQSYLNDMVEKITEIEKYRRLKRSDFPPEQNLSEHAGWVYSLSNTTFLNSQFDADEVIFEINLLGEVKTPYNEDFGRIEGTGEIIRGADESSKDVVAKVMGNYCYANNQKIGRFVAQTD